MGFGGAAQGMILSIKNNNNLRRKHKHFDKKKISGYGKSDKPELDFPKATPQILREIRIRMQREHKQRRIKQFTLLSFVLIIMVSAFVYYM